MPVSIFNDVIGPVMRGSSSSHCAAALRIGRLARDLMNDQINEVLVEFDQQGSLATTHESQGSDMGLFSGLMGFEADDARVPDSARLVWQAGIVVRMNIINCQDKHPNTYRLTLTNDQEQHTLIAISTGGGMIEIIDIDGFDVSVQGDYFETLIMTKENPAEHLSFIQDTLQPDEIRTSTHNNQTLVDIKAQTFFENHQLESITRQGAIETIHHLAPVLPVMSRKNMQVPFTTAAELLAYDNDQHEAPWQPAVYYETRRSGLTEQEVLDRMLDIVTILRNSIQEGIQGTQYDDRILGHQSGLFQTGIREGSLLDAGMLNHMIMNITALMEVKSSMGVIVAAPTAGSCAALPGACIAATDALHLSDEDAAKAMLAGGLIGALIASASTFAAEVAGCMAECGSASGMAAAALASLAGGDIQQAVAAASMAMQNSMGMTCDPVGNRVEVPCLGKNIMAASNALCCANMALAGYDAVVSLDEVIETMDRVGKSLPRELRCTALGGLSITPTAKAIEKQLHDRKE
jgi:L-serine dehydratase